MIKTFSDISEQALAFRRKTLGLQDHQVIEDYIEPAEKAGFCLFVLPLAPKFDTTQEKGFLLSAKELDFIFINSSNYYCSQAHTLWHEMYHFVEKHDDFEYAVKEQRMIEKEAEQFAACVQVPPSELEKLAQNKVHNNKLFISDIQRLALHFKCHYQTMHIQIKNVFPDFAKTNKYFKNLYMKHDDFNGLSLEEIDQVRNIRKTHNKYISPIVFETIESNYDNKKINDDMLSELIDYIKEVKSLDE